MSKLLKAMVLAALIISTVDSGGFVVLKRTRNQVVYGLKPSCANSASDTIGPFDISEAKHFSLGFLGNKIVTDDTAIVDSAKMTVNCYTSTAEDSSKMTRVTTADSSVSTIYTLRNEGKARGLELDAAPYLYLVVKRTDVGAVVFNLQNSAGAPDSTIMTFTVIKDVQ